MTLLFLTAATVVYLDKAKIAASRSKSSNQVEKSKGLIISLGLLAKNDYHDRFKKILKKVNLNPQEFRKGFELSFKKKQKSQIENEKNYVASNSDALSDIEFFWYFITETSLFPALAAIMFHLEVLEHLWVIISGEARERSYPLFQEIVDKFIINPAKSIIIHEEQVTDASNVDEISDIVNRIYSTCDKQNLDEADITTDITSGTAAMSAGCILAVVRSKRRAQYLRQSDFKFQKVEVTISALRYLAHEIVTYFESEIMTEKIR